MDEDAGLVLAAAMTGGIFVVLLVLLVVVLVRRRWLDREGVASGRGFVLFGVCCQDGNQGRFVRTSLARSRQRAARGGEEADDEPDGGELERWKRMFGGPTRCLSTIEEATEKGTSPVATPAFCSPAASPDRRDARTMQTASAGVLKS